MLIFGSRGYARDLGAVQLHQCPQCVQERPFHILLRYRIWHVWFIFAVVTSRVYTLSCHGCGHATPLQAAEVEPFIGRSPIPLLHRWGLAMLVALVGLYVLLSQLGIW